MFENITVRELWTSLAGDLSLVDHLQLRVTHLFREFILMCHHDFEMFQMCLAIENVQEVDEGCVTLTHLNVSRLQQAIRLYIALCVHCSISRDISEARHNFVKVTDSLTANYMCEKYFTAKL